jgi:hypothetical protein
MTNLFVPQHFNQPSRAGGCRFLYKDFAPELSISATNMSCGRISNNGERALGGINLWMLNSSGVQQQTTNNKRQNIQN